MEPAASKVTVVAPSTEQIRNTWDLFSDYYAEKLQPVTLQLATIAVSCLDIRKLPGGSSLLEVGCGPGETLELICRTKNAGTSISAGDLSSKMVDLCKEREVNGIRLESLVSLQQLDAEKLPFSGDSFDRYLSNLVLQIVNDPDQMLREACRVLKKDGSSFAVFTAWGRPEKSPMFTIPAAASAKVFPNLNPEIKDRSSFHLGVDLEATKSRVLAAGFKRVLAWYQTIVFAPIDVDAFTETMLGTPASRANCEKLSPAMKESLFNDVRSHAREILDSGRPIEWENIVIVAHA